jgi:hypothetical protein
MNFKTTACKLFLSGIFLLTVTGCGSTYHMLTPVDPAHAIKPARLAVISGDKSELDKNLARLLTEELQTRTTFQVLTQEEISKKVNKYPVPVEVIKPADPKKPVWFSSDGKKKLDAIQAQLKVDYLFVIWGSELTYYHNRSESKYYARVLGNMLEYPKGEVVTVTDFFSSRRVRFWEILKKESVFVDEIISNSARWITDEFLVVTKAEKVITAENSK